jgi:hypothetical protein
MQLLVEKLNEISHIRLNSSYRHDAPYLSIWFMGIHDLDSFAITNQKGL